MSRIFRKPKTHRFQKTTSERIWEVARIQHWPLGLDDDDDAVEHVGHVDDMDDGQVPMVILDLYIITNLISKLTWSPTPEK